MLASHHKHLSFFTNPTPQVIWLCLFYKTTPTRPHNACSSFLGTGEMLPVWSESPYLWLKERGKKREKIPCPQKWTAYIVTSHWCCFPRGLSNKKAESYYSTTPFSNHETDLKLVFLTSHLDGNLTYPWRTVSFTRKETSSGTRPQPLKGNRRSGMLSKLQQKQLNATTMNWHKLSW